MRNRRVPSDAYSAICGVPPHPVTMSPPGSKRAEPQQPELPTSESVSAPANVAVFACASMT